MRVTLFSSLTHLFLSYNVLSFEEFIGEQMVIASIRSSCSAYNMYARAFFVLLGFVLWENLSLVLSIICVFKDLYLAFFCVP